VRQKRAKKPTELRDEKDYHIATLQILTIDKLLDMQWAKKVQVKDLYGVIDKKEKAYEEFYKVFQGVLEAIERKLKNNPASKDSFSYLKWKFKNYLFYSSDRLPTKPKTGLITKTDKTTGDKRPLTKAEARNELEPNQNTFYRFIRGETSGSADLATRDTFLIFLRISSDDLEKHVKKRKEKKWPKKLKDIEAHLEEIKKENEYLKIEINKQNKKTENLSSFESFNELNDKTKKKEDLLSDISKEVEKAIKKALPNFDNEGELEKTINQYRYKALNHNEQEFSKWFDRILNTDKIKNVDYIKIDELIDADSSNWANRATITSALSLSLLKKWDIRKVKLLKRLAEKHQEPLTSERAIIGLAIALLGSYKSGSSENRKKFNKTLTTIEVLGNSDRNSVALFEMLNFFLKVWENFQDPRGVSDLYNKIKPIRTEKYLLFKPLEFKKSKWIKRSDKDDLDFLMNRSISLSFITKELILRDIDNSQKSDSTYEFLEILREERNKVEELFENYERDVIRLRCNRVIEEFGFILRNRSELSDFAYLLDKKREKIFNVKPFSTWVFRKFDTFLFAELIPVFWVFEKKLQKKCSDGTLFIQIAQVWENISQEEQALKAYDKAIELYPNKSKEAYLKKAILLDSMMKNDEALDAYLKTIEKDLENCSIAFYRSMQILREQNKFEQAIFIFDDFVRKGMQPTKADYDIKASCSYNLGKIEETLSIYDEMLEKYPDEEEDIYFSKSNILSLEDRLEEAIILYEKILILNEDFDLVRFYRANSLREIGKLDKAILAYDDYLTRHPDFARGYIEKAEMHSQRNEKEEAYKTLVKFVKKNSDSREAYRALIDFLDLNEEKEEKIKVLKKAVKKFKDDYESLYELALTYFDLKRYDFAIKSFQQVVLFGDEFAAELGNCYLVKSNESKSLSNYIKSIRKMGENDFFEFLDNSKNKLFLHGVTKTEYNKIYSKLSRYPF